MPGVIMETFNVGGNAQESGTPDSRNGVSTLDPSAHMQAAGHGHCTNHTNGLVKGADAQKQSTQSYTGTMGLTGPVRPPELPHITQGFFPFSTLINRSVQQCWNDLSDLIAELAEHQVPFQSSDSAPGNNHGKNMGNQSQENLQKKLRILDFAHTRRAEFIKILVLSQWSRQAADVSRLIDIQSFIRLRHQAYLAALQWVGDMKRDLVQAQVGNPDLQTALEVLTTGKVVSMPTLGYNPLKPLTTKETHKRLLKINRIISVRLMLCDSVPLPFQTYRVHDGRVTFTVPNEFELDLSIGAEDEASQFFFVDIRFLFTPSSPIPKGRMFNELDMRINEILCNNGLAGCFEMLHGLVLTNKINTLFKQALDLGRGLWSDTLRVELLHRTLVLQYWALKPGPKSWLEIGIKGNRRNNENDGGGTPYIGLRWIRDGQQVNSEDINFGTGSLSMECILRSVIALHISHILSAVYQKLRKNKLFSTGALSLRGQLSRVEPGACRLGVQLTQSRHLRISIETMSGMSIMSATPTTLERFDGDRSSEKPIIDDIVSRVARLRCTSAIDEVESSARSLGFQIVNLRSLKLDVRRSFPANVIRFSFFHHRSWDRHWILAATSSMDGDNWWAVQLQPDMIPSSSFALGANTNNVSVPRSIQVVCSSFSPAQSQDTCVPFVNTGHGLFGMLTIQANARYLEDLQSVSFQPPPSQLTIEPNLRVPDIFMRYQPAKLPRALQIATPCGLSKKLFIKETIRIAFHGVNPQDKAAIVVAYGTLMMPPGIAAALVSRRDHSLVLQERGSNFAIRLLAPAGRSVIPDLVESLQRLECVLTILETLQRKKMQPQSLSLSHIAFLYGPCHQLSARIEIKLTTSFLQTVADPSHLASLEKPLFHVNLGIVFEHPNPHRRIQGPLTSILNNNTTTSGLDTVTELLSLTLPLMRALDLIMTNPSHKDLLRVQVTVRNAKTFQIHYPIHKVRFHLIAGQRLSRMIWILRDISGIQNMPNQDQLKSRLQENLYNSRGDGWRGLGNGAVASVEKVGNLLAELDKCLFGADDIRSLNGVHPKAKVASTKSTSAPLVKPPLAAMETEITQHRATATNDADIIMID